MPRPQKRSHSVAQGQTQSNEAEEDEQSPQQRPRTDLTDLATQALRNVVAATRSCNSFPQGKARDLYMTYPGYARVVDEQSQRVLGLIGKVLHSQQIKGNIHRRQVDEQFEMVQECNDMLFERINTNLDIKSGLRRNQHMVLETQVDVLTPGSETAATAKDMTASPSQLTTPRAGSWNRTYINGMQSRGMVSARLYTAKNIMRPQMEFKVPVDNSAQTPFVPRLREKPNSLKPLALLPEYDEAGNIVAYLHPYEFELLKFEPRQLELKAQQPQLPEPPAQTELMLVDTVEKLNQALEELRQVSQIAIDVEHHSYRTFMGITCLVQMSTRHKDYIFDTLTLREDMHLLNLVLTDPKVLKILHGADLDVEWLQRDLALYIVNMFDTHRAAKALNLARLSLAFLLKHYVDLDVDKSFQLADWRMRPLPSELINYARQDTHYLIYIYERLTNDLLESDHGKTGALRAVYQLSTEVCKKRYTKPHINQDSHLDLVRKTKRSFDNRQLYALRGIFAWRDATARHEDESYGYVLPNHMMLQIAESLPREMQGILACCNPIPPLVRQQLHILHQIVLRAREQPLVKPVLETRSNVIVAAPSTKYFNRQLHCPHDLTHMEEARDDLPTLLQRQANGKLQPKQRPTDNPMDLAAPALRLFGHNALPKLDQELRWWRAYKERQTMRMPYKRYLAILPLMEQLQRDQAAREHSELLKRRLCPTEAAPADIKLESSNLEAHDQDNDDMYSLPLKEQLKRKHQHKTNAETETSQTPNPKRFKRNDCKTPVKSEAHTSQQAAAGKPDTVLISDDDDNAVVERPIGRQPPDLTKRQRKRKRRQQQGAKAKSQSSNQPVQLPKTESNFDYGKVNFRQFQGGAQRARGTEIKPQMHGKNRPNTRNNKQFNKLFTFSNVKKEGKK